MNMTTTWLLNTLGLLLATLGAIFMYVYPMRGRSLADAQPEYEKRNARSRLAVGVLALGFLLQYLAVIV
jgi:hypothetical protein